MLMIALIMIPSRMDEKLGVKIFCTYIAFFWRNFEKQVGTCRQNIMYVEARMFTLGESESKQYNILLLGVIWTTEI